MSVRQIQYGIIGIRLPYIPFDEELDMKYSDIHADLFREHQLVEVSDGMSGEYTIIGRMISYENDMRRSSDPENHEASLTMADLAEIFNSVYDAIGVLPGLENSADGDVIKLFILQHYT